MSPMRYPRPNFLSSRTASEHWHHHSKFNHHTLNSRLRHNHAQPGTPAPATRLAPPPAAKRLPRFGASPATPADGRAPELQSAAVAPPRGLPRRADGSATVKVTRRPCSACSSSTQAPSLQLKYSGCKTCFHAKQKRITCWWSAFTSAGGSNREIGNEIWEKS